MAPFLTSPQRRFRGGAGERRECAFQSEKFSARRPSLTCPITNQETGATPLYHGHRVSSEWQSKQARRTVACTSEGMLTCAAIVSDALTDGLVRAGLNS